MNNLFRGIPFSQEDEIYAHIQVSLLVGRRTKGKSCLLLLSIFEGFQKGLSAEISFFNRKIGNKKPGE